MNRAHIAALTIVLVLAAPTRALYSAGSAIINLTPATFEKRVKERVTLIEFYAPWCGHCKSLAPEWERAAAALQGVIPVAAVDADAHKDLGAKWGVKGFPTIKLFYTNSKGELKAADYSGGRTAKDITSWAMQQATKLAMGRLGAKASGGSSAGGSGSGSGGGGSGGGGGNSFYPRNSGVVTLDDSNFNKLVVSSDDLWAIEFYAPWCGHCAALKPTWIDLAKTLDGRGTRVGAVDCDANPATCKQYRIQGFPTLKYFGANKDQPEEYTGGRDLTALAEFFNQRWAAAQPPPEVRELTDDDVWIEHCRGHPADAGLDLKAVRPKQLCLVAFLPHILDAKASGRNAHLTMLRALAEEAKDRPFAWFWAEGGVQPGLEANLGVGGYGYPAFIALNPEKAKFATLRGGFEAAAVRDFLGNVRTGRERVAPVEGELGALAGVAPWDGGDGAEEVEEEFSLEDLGIGGGDAQEEL